MEDFKVATLRLTPNAENCHKLYLREHFIRLVDSTKPRGRTLLILNVPPYVTLQSMRRFFKTIGTIVNIHFAAKPGKEESRKWAEKINHYTKYEEPFRFKVCYVVFEKSSSIQKAIKLKTISLFNKKTGESYVESGMQLWLNDYNDFIVNEDEAEIALEKYMEDYDRRMLEEKKANKNTEADAEGWITVGKTGHGAGFEKKEAVLQNLELKIERSKNKRELTDFYSFQIREAKMDELMKLRDKYEEDKRKIENMKKSRRFIPF